jgi:hypothetical protein
MYMSNFKIKKNKLNSFKPKIFKINDLTWKKYLDKEGYVVFNNAVTKKQKELVINMFKKDLNIISPSFKWDDLKTWTSKNAPIVFGKSSAVYCGFGHCDTNWYLRLKSKAEKIFKKAYNTNDLVVSFDGMSFFFSDKQKSQNSWLHQDQRSSDKRISYQGVLNLLERTSNDAGFICIPRSHKEYKAPDSNRDWIIIPKNSEYQNKAIKLITPERSLILFNSKLIHANCGMEKKHPKGIHINRLSAYITFVPRSRQPIEIRQKRIDKYLSGKSCSHWADRYEPKKMIFYLSKKFSLFNTIKPSLTIKNNIPSERLRLF